MDYGSGTMFSRLLEYWHIVGGQEIIANEKMVNTRRALRKISEG